MLYEYAIEPDVLGTWDKCRNILNLMGFANGRAIAAYPTRKRWKRMVRESARNAGCGERELLRIVETLEQQNRKFLQIPRGYDETLEPTEEQWVRNAVSQQSTPSPFDAIISTRNPSDHGSIILEPDVVEANPRLAGSRSARVLREANALAAHVRTLIRSGSSLLLIDPHFEPHVDRWWPVVKACLAEAMSGATQLTRIEIHTLDTNMTATFAIFARSCRANARAFVPAGMGPVRVVRWRIRSGTPADFHARYIVTERGGYKLDKGLDEEVGVEQPVDLLDEPTRQRVWDEYQDPTAVFDKDGELTLP